MKRLLPLLLLACLTASAAPLPIFGGPGKLVVAGGGGGDPDPGGGEEPASGHVGYNNSGQSMSAERLVIDGRIDLQSTGFNAIWLNGSGTASRAAVMEYVPSGGFWGGGFNRLWPGNYTGDGGNPLGEHYLGIGQITGFASAGDARRLTVGMLLRFGSDFWDDQPADIKLLILLRSAGMRPMVISKNGSTTRVLGACDGTVCNTTNNPESPDWHNSGNHQPDIENFNDEWVWVEYQVDTVAGVVRTKLWTVGGEHEGTTVTQYMESAPGDEISGLDILAYVLSVPTLSEDGYYDFQRLEIQLGTGADLTPPEGFPGSMR